MTFLQSERNKEQLTDKASTSASQESNSKDSTEEDAVYLECDICGKQFLTQDFLTKHMFRRHGKVQADSPRPRSKERKAEEVS